MSRGIEISSVAHLLSVGTPMGVSVDLTEVVRGYEIKFLGRVFHLDLYVLGFQGFVVILGMDWLKENSIKLDCGEKKVIMPVAGQRDWVQRCETPGDSVLTSFLYTLEISGKPVEEVEVVRDFPDVFAEVTGLPPRRIVEFRIDLVPGAAPIAKAAYRMAPKELEEMKKQLDELLQKG